MCGCDRDVQYLVFCVVFCRSLYTLSLLAIVLSVLRFATFYCPFPWFMINCIPSLPNDIRHCVVLPSIYSIWLNFGIFKHFLDHYSRNLHEHFCEFYFYFCLFVCFNIIHIYIYQYTENEWSSNTNPTKIRGDLMSSGRVSSSCSSCDTSSCHC
jgi:hypothetical protein